MSDIVDDLLQEVEQLEETTQELESTNQKVNDQANQLKNASANASAEANVLALEAAKTAQEASVQSHRAAQAAIKQAENLKAQALELNESNFNWRQAVRNAAKDFQSAKSSFTIMLTTAIVFSLITMGSMGYLYYTMKKEEAQFKGEVLDIITTENTLLNKKVTLKIDELASVIENLTYEVSKINDKAVITQAPITPVESTEQPKQQDIPVTMDKTEDGLIGIDLAKEANDTDSKPAIKTESESNKQTEQVAVTTQDKSSATLGDTSQLQTSVDWIKEHSVTQKDFTELQTLVAKVLKAQETLETQTKNLKATPATSSSGLTSKQIKKLNDISWLVRTQTKTLKSIEAKLGLQSGSKTNDSGLTILNELKKLHAQQTVMQNQMNDLQGKVKKLADTPKEAPPYSYKAK